MKGGAKMSENNNHVKDTDALLSLLNEGDYIEITPLCMGHCSWVLSPFSNSWEI